MRAAFMLQDDNMQENKRSTDVADKINKALMVST
jgi:hypothetical protein